jgi:hypothetical protein
VLDVAAADDAAHAQDDGDDADTAAVVAIRAEYGVRPFLLGH